MAVVRRAGLESHILASKFLPISGMIQLKICNDCVEVTNTNSRSTDSENEENHGNCSHTSSVVLEFSARALRPRYRDSDTGAKVLL